jgi:hypothetical protein
MKETVVTCLEVVSQHWLQEAEENYEFISEEPVFWAENRVWFFALQATSFDAVQTSRSYSTVA